MQDGKVSSRLALGCGGDHELSAVEVPRVLVFSRGHDAEVVHNRRMSHADAELCLRVQRQHLPSTITKFECDIFDGPGDTSMADECAEDLHPSQRGITCTSM